MIANVPVFCDGGLLGTVGTLLVLYVFFLSTTNKMQYYIIFFITVNALHVSGGFSVHHQELKNFTHSIGYMSSLLAATARGSSKQA